MRIKLIRITAVLLLLATGVMLGLIGFGVFDPRPVGDVQWRQALSTQTTPAQEREIIWLERPFPAAPCTVRLTAAHAAGELDSLYGLALGAPGNFLAVAVSPLGYVTIWREEPSAVSRQPSAVSRQPLAVSRQQSGVYGIRITDYGSRVTDHGSRITDHLPLQPWPHVRTGTKANEIWVDVEDGRFTVRLNREWLWTEEVNLRPQQMGTIGRSFGAAAEVDFQTATLTCAAPASSGE